LPPLPECAPMFTKAIVRPPAPNFAEGLTTAGLGTPDYEQALAQHEAYCAALEQSGLKLIRLDVDPNFPDSTFVEDTAIVTERGAILTRPGAPSRAGEVKSMRRTLVDHFPSLQSIQLPGTLDGGDVCQAGDHFFIGISERTNEAGAQQLARMLASFSYTTSFIDIRLSGKQSVPGAVATGSAPELLHLKSGIAYLGDNRMAVIQALADRAEFSGYELVRVEHDEAHAANCIRVNEHVLVTSSGATFERKLRDLGYQTLTLEMSEFQKMDGGLSCLSLRW
jgi:dimethylargininase